MVAEMCLFTVISYVNICLESVSDYSPSDYSPPNKYFNFVEIEIAFTIVSNFIFNASIVQNVK